jgi:hypothetical protein
MAEFWLLSTSHWPAIVPLDGATSNLKDANLESSAQAARWMMLCCNELLEVNDLATFNERSA